MMKKQFLTATLVASTLTAASYGYAPSAQALTFDAGANSVTLTAADAGKSFTIYFNGFLGSNSSNTIDGLTSEAVFKFLGFSTVGSNTEAAFEVDLTNTSSSPITASRVSVLGFNATPNLRGVGILSGGPGNTRVSGIFTRDRALDFPSGVGNPEVCFTTDDCDEGDSGPLIGETDTFSPILAFSGPVNSFTLDNFFVRYEDIRRGSARLNDASGVGKVPTPALLPGLVGLGMGLLRKKKQLEKVA